MPRGTLKLLLAGPEGVDFCKLRLLPDRESYKGPKTPPGQMSWARWEVWYDIPCHYQNLGLDLVHDRAHR